MDFISPEKPPKEEDDLVTDDPFWPTVSPKNYRAVMRENDGTIIASRLKDALTHAMIEVACELRDWQTEKKREGFNQLTDIPALQINDDSALCLLYERAVFGLAKANLSERFRDIDTQASGHKKADSLSPTIDDYRRDALWAIARIKGQSHNVVALI
ncbi:head completion/stabilization protein [Arsenophonus nasoniae]|uniref:Head completion/stabilization protein n=1 Tax=Arsenophonus nasoniae TaxID=638 RepID=A0AA95GVN4_9GAMM|nr:head completion/stabilization protein [Arsenophonus nasoniae]WGM04021.1 head completion/stabilization protein [Arsenophonus nasoniae]